MKFPSFNDFENQKTFETIYNKNTNQMLGFQNDKSIENKLIDQNNLNAYQAKSDSKIRENISINDKFNKKKNSINKVLEKINNKNNELKQSNNDSTKDSNIDDSELKDIDTKKVLKNMILCKSNNEYINANNTKQMLWPNKNFNNNNCYNNNINGNLEDINTKEVLLKFKKSNSVNINSTDTLETDIDGKTKNILYLIGQNKLNNNNQNNSSERLDQGNIQFFNNDKNVYVYSNNDNNAETHIMPNKNEMINNQFNQNQYINNMRNVNVQNSLFNNNNNNNFNNGMYYGNFKIYSNNS